MNTQDFTTAAEIFALVALCTLCINPFVVKLEELELEPSFVSKSGVYSVVKGQSLTLPCKFDKPSGDFGVLWQRFDLKNGGMDEEPSVLFVERSRIVDDKRLSYVNADDQSDWSIKIDNLSPDIDHGIYDCRLNTEPYKNQSHIINVKSPPVVYIFPEKSPEVVKIGSPLTLKCQARGNPQPTITWTKSDGNLPPSDYNSADQLIFRSATNAHEGTYRCTADNGVGQPAHAQVTVLVVSVSSSDAYQPRVNIESKVITVKTGQPFNVTCFFSANPSPTVEWFFSGYKLEVGSEKNKDRLKIVQNNGGGDSATWVSSVLVNKASYEDFGDYTCRIVNSVGKTEATISVTGTPESPLIKLNFDPNTDPSSVVVLWTISSVEPIVEYQLDYKKDSDRDYRSTIVAANSEDDNAIDGNVYSSKYLIENLEPESSYQILVKARNKNGWGKNAVETFKTGKIPASKQKSESKDETPVSKPNSARWNLPSNSRHHYFLVTSFGCFISFLLMDHRFAVL